ncbi:hypothetical protein OK016_19250 [Vibrio chagasii]|nr:hypothetical protein [Vibrio chagasii]
MTIDDDVPVAQAKVHDLASVVKDEKRAINLDVLGDRCQECTIVMKQICDSFVSRVSIAWRNQKSSSNCI